MSLPSLNDNSKKNQGLPSIDDSPKGFGLPSIDDSSVDDYIDEPLYQEPEEEHEDFGSYGDGFTEVSTEESLDEYDDYNNEIYDDVDGLEEEESELPSMNYSEGRDYESENDYNPDYDEDLEEADKNKFIDKKKKKLLPFGGKKSKVKVKSSDFDDRKNVLSTTKIVRAIVMFIIAILFILGIKNTFFPSHVYTDDEIRNFAREGSGQTLFPRERGEAFVENFMEAYLTIDRSRPELVEMLSYYYGEGSFGAVGYEKANIKPGSDVQQHIIVKPTIFDVELLTDYSAMYKVSAYVSDASGNSAVEGRSTGRWVSFAINVYHDKRNDGLAITPDSPIIIPTYEISKRTDVPNRAPFGNGTVNNEIAPAINPTINGFVQAYAKSSLESHESILQYIEDKNDIKLYDGFGGALKLNGEPSQAIQRTIYNGDDGIYRVILTIDWVDSKASEGGKKIEYQGRYIMRVNPDGAGKYTVSSFVPYTYYKE